MKYPNWYTYYRLLFALSYRNGEGAIMARTGLQDVLCDFRLKSEDEWPSATSQQIQDWFEYLANKRAVVPLTIDEARSITQNESDLYG